MKNKLLLSLAFSFILLYTGCKKMETDNSSYSTEPILPASPYDYTNSSNDDLATLGRVLFYDKKLSLNNSVSCGSCHKQIKAFADDKQFSVGLKDSVTRRNSPPVALHSASLFWDGRAANFHDLAMMPLVNHVEMMNYDISRLEDKIQNTSYYPDLFVKAFGNSNVSIDHVQTAIAEFLVNFEFLNNRYFQSNEWAGGNVTLTSLESLGQILFYNKARCGNCHGGSFFAGWENGGECIGLDDEYTDNGIGERTHNTADNAKFRVPTLLNIEYTAPYMHDGRFKTLEEVVEHYNSGIHNHPNLSWALRDSVGEAVKLNLNTTEKKALVAFLKALSDPSVFTDVRFNDPFVKH